MRVFPIVVTLSACLAGASRALATPPKASAAEMKSVPAMQKLGPMLSEMVTASRARAFAAAAMDERVNKLMRIEGDYVVVDVAAEHNIEELEAELRALGVQDMASHGRLVSGRIPIASLQRLAASKAVRFARPAAVTTDVGLVDTQGDRSMRTDEVREEFDIDGTGTRVGVLSDSFNCRFTPLGSPIFTTAAEDFANDDLPADVIVLSDINSGCIDEGRAILQLIHDVAPGAAGAFHTAINGQADFADGIIELAFEAGSDVIVDDIIYFAEPMFQDGIIAQAADTVRALGVPYYSSAGNRARSAYQSEFRLTKDIGYSGPRHDFDPGQAVDTLQSITAPAGDITIFSFQWDEPYFAVSGQPGSGSDVDFLFYFDDGTRVPFCETEVTTDFVCQFPGITPNIGGDPIEVVAINNPTTVPLDVNIAFELIAGPAPNLMKYVNFGNFAPNEFDTATPSGYGHNHAAGAEAVGAAIFTQTEEFPQPDLLGLVDVPCIPACVNSFSSAGGTPILFDLDGNRLPNAIVRLKPGVTGPDGGNTSFFFADSIRDPDDFPNFFGTSASAPHVAAAAALAFDFENSGIAKTWKGEIMWTVCVAENEDNETEFETLSTSPDDARALIDSGQAVFRACEAFSADDVIELFRNTAQDMRLRAFPSLAGGTALEVPNPEGFDFDTGFGFVDIFAAIGTLADGGDEDEND